jgi:hypothetical protein
MTLKYRQKILLAGGVAAALALGFFVVRGLAAGTGENDPRAFPPLATSTPETTALPGHMRLYASAPFHFSLTFPEELKVTQYTERDNAMTVTFENPDNTQSFEVYVTPYNKTQIDSARFKLDEPSGTYLEPQDVVISGTTATMFFGRNGIMGDTREVWFIKDGFLYEVATYKPLDAWLGQVMQGWKFI